ncbi:MAG: T9SS type A sorting domain-containing protein [Candidatus Zixiibacteriota bacterium]|nr:MAG: T9SS type A sorting domain-containing protein [candidate division Zixibacteria bacterium]
MADTSGTYTIEVVAASNCGSDTCNISIDITIEEPASITCPIDPANIYLCEPEQVCFPLEISPAGATVTTSYGTYAEGQLCFYADTSGMYVIQVIAETECGADTCYVSFDVRLRQGPWIDCPTAPIDTFLCQPGQICLPISITPPDVVVSASFGSYADGRLCFPADTSGTYPIDIIADAECGSDTCQVILNVTIEEPFEITCPGDTSLFLCEPDTICFPIQGIPDGASVIVTPESAWYDDLNHTICCTLDSTEDKEIAVIAESGCHADSCSFTISVTMNSPPTVTTPVNKINGPIFLCEPEEICVPVSISDIDNNIIDINVSPQGYYNESTSSVCFTPTESGTYVLTVTATDECLEADSAFVVMEVVLNSPPQVVSAPDTSVITCLWGPICLPVSVTDIDDNVVSVSTNIGTYENDQICFTPTEEGTYVVIVTAIDACEATDQDTTVVTVIAGEPFSLICPGDTSVFICDPDTLCFAVGGIPIGADVTIFPQSAWYDSQQGTICFYTNCSVEKNLKIVVENECGADSCTFSVDVTMNSKPLVIMPPDMNMTVCEIGEICIPVGISDADNNVVSVSASGGATYNPITNRVCFTPATSGEYVIKIRALDGCGAADLDSTVVTVTLNSPPEIVAEAVIDTFLCEPSEVCFPVDIPDPDNNVLAVSVLPSGTYDPDNGTVCFLPTDAGMYVLVITAADSCGMIDQDTVQVNVRLNHPPDVDAGPDTTIITCQQRAPICVPVSIVDQDDDLDSVYVVGGEYQDGFVCIDAQEPGSYEIIITAVDCCHARTFDTLVIDIVLNTCPIVVSASDTSVIQCSFDLEEICVNVDVIDQEDNVQSVAANLGIYDPVTGTVCFLPEAAGTYSIITTAVDECGESAADTSIVTLTIEEPAAIDCPLGQLSFTICQPETLCYLLDITPASAVVSTSYGTYEDGYLCFMADTSGIYIIQVVADALCGTDTCEIEIVVEIGQPPQIACPPDTSVFLCDAGTACVPVEVTPEYSQVSVLPIGNYENGSLCFAADTAGIYSLTIIAETDCGADTCEFNVTVGFNAPPTVDAGNDTTYFQCDFQEICRLAAVLDSDNEIDSVTVSPTGFYDIQTGMLCFTPTVPGTYCLTVTAYDECGASGSDEVCITVTTGDVAVIDCPSEPFAERLCDPGQICLPLTVTPSSVEVSVSFGIYADGQICFYADTAGSYEITVIASEVCGADTCTITVNVAFDEYVEIMCPDLPISASLCSPGPVSALVPISPPSATLTITPIGVYDFATKKLTFYADTSGQYHITIIAETPCSVDTCVVQVNVVINQVPELVCPGDFDTLVCLTEVSEICFHVDVIGSGVEVTVLPEGSYSGGMVCIPISESGDYETRVVATSACGADTCELTISVIGNMTPELTVPADTLITWCEDDTGQICLDGIFAVDAEGDPVTITQVCGPGEFTPYRDDSGTVCFTPEITDTTYEFCFEATDGCSADTGLFSVTVYPSPICSVCVDLAIETDSCVVVGSSVPVNLVVQTLDPIGGFDLLVAYDASVMSFQYALKSDTIAGWEYFTHRLLQEDCPGCPSMLVRIVGIADINNGPFHPPEDQLDPQGVLATMQMLVANNQNLGGLFLPIYFFWIDCGDNSFASPSGTEQYIESRIYNASGDLIWDEADDILFPEDNRPIGFGAGDSCLVGDEISPIRCVYFHNGGICVKHPDSIDARGDVNLNGVAYEIADAVVFTNYFIYGLSAFTENVDGQIAATDVNADGYTLTIADLVYLVRVVVGDADRIPKVSPDKLKLDLAVHDDGNSLTLHADADCPLGAGLLIFRYDGIIPEIPTPGEMAENMHIAYSARDSELRVLIYSFDPGAAIAGGVGDLLSIGYTGSGNISLVEASFASFHGEVVETDLNSKLVPDQFMISQNYPNPFNPMTSIDLSLPVACHWQITIFNINGRVVRQFEGDADPGIVTVVWNGRDNGGQSVASGIYLYKVDAGGFTATRKMTILK